MLVSREDSADISLVNWGYIGLENVHVWKSPNESHVCGFNVLVKKLHFDGNLLLVVFKLAWQSQSECRYLVA